MDFYEQGRKLGLKGNKLYEFAMEKRQRQHELEIKRLELQREREREQREKEEREQERQREKEREEREAKIKEKEIELKEKEIRAQIELARIQQGQANPDREQQVPKCLKIPSFVESKDQIDTYLARFKWFAKSMKWREEDWAIRLSALLTGDALEAYTRLSDDDAAKYETVKEALLLCYNFTDKGYRQRFRECRPKPGETPRQFVARLSSYLRKWVELSGKGVDYNGLHELIVQEQFLDACPKELATFLEEQKQQTLNDLIEAADRYLKAHNKTFGPPKKHLQRDGYQEDDIQQEPTPHSDVKKGCFVCDALGHKAVDCPELKRIRQARSKSSQRQG
jgi:hypothetical protein